MAIDGVTVNEDNTREVSALIVSALDRAMEEVGLAAEGFAKRKCPVDTGNLRNSITHEVNLGGVGGHAAYVGTNVEYAAYVELGTRRTQAQPFLRPAATEHGSTYRSIIERNLRSG